MVDEQVRGQILAALESWDRDRLAARVAEAEDLRAQFVERFPLSAWQEMQLEEYALGQEIDGGTLCWWLEFNTRPVASMSGGSSKKHLVFKSRSDGTWRFPSAYGSVEEAWEAIRTGFLEAFQLAEQGRFEDIDDILSLRGAAALRLKALYMYFPDEIVPVCSKTHIDHFIQALGHEASASSVVRREPAISSGRCGRSRSSRRCRCRSSDSSSTTGLIRGAPRPW